ncbi:MAG: hypothetical protein Q9168_007681 [Polycauliona sp. 1 TL-2023]
MSSPSATLSCSKHTLPTSSIEPQEKTSVDQMDSDSSVKTESSKASSTPPTTYDDYDSAVSEGETEDIIKDGQSTASSEAEDVIKKEELVVDHICYGEAGGQCTLNSGDHRKVTSHIFGRNKRETHQIPEECWIKYCRKHYQRQKYRCPDDWFETQLSLVDAQLNRLDKWGGVIDWTIQLRKKEREIVDKENNYQAIHGSLPDGPLSRERFLLPYLGTHKTFDEVRAVVEKIDNECDATKTRSLPSFEFLPRIDERRNPRPRRGAARRGMRQPAPRTPAAPSTFRLETDDSGKLKKIETKPRQGSGTGYAAAKARTQSKKRSASNMKDEETPEPSSHLSKKRSTSAMNDDETPEPSSHISKKRSASTMNDDETPEPSSHVSKKQQSGFHAINRQTTPPSDEDNKSAVNAEVLRLSMITASSSTGDHAKKAIKASHAFRRPEKHHRRSRSA